MHNIVILLYLYISITDKMFTRFMWMINRNHNKAEQCQNEFQHGPCMISTTFMVVEFLIVSHSIVVLFYGTSNPNECVATPSNEVIVALTPFPDLSRTVDPVSPRKSHKNT